jgi:hypothetical protein
MPLTNVGTAGPGTGAAAAVAAACFGGSADALPTPTGTANTAVTALANTSRVPLCIRYPSYWNPNAQESVAEARR